MSDYKIVSTFNKVSHLNGVICFATMEKYLDKDAETLEELVRLLFLGIFSIGLTCADPQGSTCVKKYRLIRLFILTHCQYLYIHSFTC